MPKEKLAQRNKWWRIRVVEGFSLQRVPGSRTDTYMYMNCMKEQETEISSQFLFEDDKRQKTGTTNTDKPKNSKV